MANDLLDFVMGLVRDPDAAARYAADPSQAIADAQLVDVTSADVNNLIPMVTDSLSMAAPAFGAETSFDPVIDSNVWTSGAATAAFEAFDAFDPQPAGGVIDTGSVIDLAAPVSEYAPEPVTDALLVDSSALLSEVGIDESAAPAPAPWEELGTTPQPLDEGHAALDLFD